jgi:hypothetical protein
LKCTSVSTGEQITKDKFLVKEEEEEEGKEEEEEEGKEEEEEE